MPKDARVTFRINSELKGKLVTIAAKEGRSVAQVCEVFLRAGCDRYDRNAFKFLQKYLSAIKQA